LNSKETLQKYFGFDNFRPGQEKIINSILEGNDVLAIMPTGGGKSLCYQIPALMSSQFSIVISPLISLMQDQVNHLNHKEIIAGFINSSLDYSQVEKVLNDIARSKIKILFVSPEKLENKEFTERLRNLKPEYLFVDEAHCISEWGHNFRPSYTKISEFKKFSGVKSIAAFTATATPEVRADIISQLEMIKPEIFVYGFERENLSLNVIQTNQKKEKLLEILKDINGSTIVYTSTRRSAESVAGFLSSNKIDVKYYHAGLTTELRRIIQDDFINSRTEIIVATNAFGMGIDKKDIRCVVHYNIPGSIESLYQEFGRAGRDGKPAEVYLLFSLKDISIQEYFINNSTPTKEQIQFVYNTIGNVANIALGTKSNKRIPINKTLKTILKANNVSAGLLNSSLQILETAGYLKTSSNYESNTYIKFTLNSKNIKKYITSIRNNTLKNIILLLLREYGERISASMTKIDLTKIKKLLNLNESQIDENFNLLSYIGILEYDKPSSLSNVQLLTDRVDSRYLQIDAKKLEKTKLHQQKRLEKVIQYSDTTDCRFKFILDYFGESIENYRCKKCDNCLHKEHNSEPMINYLEEIIIKTLHENKRSLKVSRLYPVLSGKSKAAAARSFTTFGTCAHYSKQDIQQALDRLLTQKKVFIKSEMLFLHENGFETLTNFPEEINTESSLNKYERNLILFNELRNQRKLASSKYLQPANLICSDSILREIAERKPDTPSKLFTIKGFNQRMFNKVGEDFLFVIKEFLKKSQNQNISNKQSVPKDLTQTISLIKKGYRLEDIANIMKLPIALLSLQIESILEYQPDISIKKLFNPKELEQIQDKLRIGNLDIKEIKKELPHNISYAKIRIVLAKKRLSEGN